MNNTNQEGETVFAFVGERAIKMALTQAESEMVVCHEKGIPFFPSLGIRQNAVNLRMAMETKQQSLFWELLKVSGLRRAGWNLPFRKDQPGKLRMWGVVLGLTLQAGLVLAIEPMAGMSPEDREDFAELLRYCQGNDLRLIFTAYRLKDVMELRVTLPLRLAMPNGWRDTNTEEMKLERAALGEPAAWDMLQMEWEGECNG